MINNAIKPYLDLIRFDKQIGTMLLFWPCSFGVLLSTKESINYVLLIKFWIGSFIMRSAGCIINDLWDRDIDKLVERTKSRPLASGKISPIQAEIFLVLLLVLGLFLLLTFSKKAILFSFLCLPMVVFYPVMKRYTFYPQVFLGLVFNYGCLVAAMEINGKLWFSDIILYLACIFWTLGYDTIYGFMDIDDDKRINVKSMSRLIENKNPLIVLTSFYMIVLLGIVGSIEVSGKEMSLLSYIFVYVGLSYVLWIALTLKLNNKLDCLYKFKSNNLFGLILFFVFVSV